jgi:hypothetical protein
MHSKSLAIWGRSTKYLSLSLSFHNACRLQADASEADTFFEKI